MAKKYLACFTLIAVFFLALFLCSCSTVIGNGKSDFVSVTVIDSPLYTAVSEDGGTPQSVFKVKRNSSGILYVRVADGYYISGVDYEKADINYTSNGLTAITLNELKFSTRISFSCSTCDAIVYYCANGGTFQSSYADTIGVPYSKAHHLRVNTLTGAEELKRNNYVLIGWNTEQDGSGEHIGLGSRVSVDGSITLYAEWLKETRLSCFEYGYIDDGIVIEGYNGSDIKVVVPQEIEGKNVVNISEGAFSNCNFESIVLPDTLQIVEKGAFQDCDFKELYLYDNIVKIYDDSFISCNNFSTLHINAFEPPRYTDLDRHSNLTDKYDILIENSDKPKIIAFGGSGTYFSLDTKQMESEFTDYVCINMGVNAYFNAPAQFEMMLPYLNENDIFIHAPEAASEYQFMVKTDMSDTRFIMALESNYDLLALVDLRHVTGTFDAFTAFNDAREDLEPKSYSDYVSFIDDRGNYALDKTDYGKDEAISDEANINVEFVWNRENIRRLNGYYSLLKQRGIRLFLSGAPVNRQALSKQNKDYEGYAAVFQVQAGQNFAYPYLVSLPDCIYDGHIFFNSDYHLSDKGTRLHTQKVINALKAQLENGKGKIL